jgi:RNA polymerase sigma factor (sigma-70 family)
MDVEALYERYGPMVMRRCRQLLHDDDRALDVTQDVFIQVLRHQGRLTDEFPSSLLYRVATNLCLNRLRDEGRRRESTGDDLLSRIASSEDLEAAVGARAVLERLFRRHQESTRIIAVLHYVDGLTLEETAQEVGMSVSGVRKRLRGLRASLKELERS